MARRHCRLLYRALFPPFVLHSDKDADRFRFSDPSAHTEAFDPCASSRERVDCNRSAALSGVDDAGACGPSSRKASDGRGIPAGVSPGSWLAFARSCFAFLMARICEGSEVMIWSSVYEAMTLIATCFKPAKKIPSPTSLSSSRYFSSSESLNVCCTRSTEVGDCRSSIWMEELVIIGMP